MNAKEAAELTQANIRAVCDQMTDLLVKEIKAAAYSGKSSVRFEHVNLKDYSVPFENRVKNLGYKVKIHDYQPEQRFAGESKESFYFTVSWS